MRKCGKCGKTGHNARTCSAKETKKPKIQVVKPSEEKLEKVKRAVAIQNIGESNLVGVKNDSIVPNSVLEDPSFWDFDQRKLIARELLKLRGKKEIVVIAEPVQEKLEVDEVMEIADVIPETFNPETGSDPYMAGILER